MSACKDRSAHRVFTRPTLGVAAAGAGRLFAILHVETDSLAVGARADAPIIATRRGSVCMRSGSQAAPSSIVMVMDQQSKSGTPCDAQTWRAQGAFRISSHLDHWRTKLRPGSARAILTPELRGQAHEQLPERAQQRPRAAAARSQTA